MADVELSRREARRKRILENSHNRLQLISNITNDDCCTESPVNIVKTSIPEQNNETPDTAIENTLVREPIYNGETHSEPIYNGETHSEPIYNGETHSEPIYNGETHSEPIYNGETPNEPISYEFLSDNNLQNVLFGEQDNNDSTAFAVPNAELPAIPLFEKLITNKYDLVLVSLFIQLLHSFSIKAAENTYFFFPLVLYTATKMLFLPKYDNFKYANILLIMNGVDPQLTEILVSVLQWVCIILQDLGIYLFTTICIQSFCIVMSDIIS